MRKYADTLTGKNEMNWKIDKCGVLTIEGQGKIPDYDCGQNPSAPWKNVKEQIAEIHIKDGITEIGIHAFENCENLRKVVLPCSMKRIQAYAFRNCSALDSVETNGKRMQYIRDHQKYDEKETIIFSTETFHNVPWCRSQWGDFYIQDYILYLTFTEEKKPVIPKGVRVLKSFSLSHLKLKSIMLPITLEEIEDFAFFDSTLERTISLPETVCKVGSYAFADCSVPGISFPCSLRPDKMDWYRTKAKLTRRGKRPEVIKRYSIKLLKQKKFGAFKKLELAENKPIYHKDGTVTKVSDEKWADVGTGIYRRIRIGKVLLCVSYEDNTICSVKSFSRNEEDVDEYLMYPVWDPGEELLPWRDSFTLQEKDDIIYAFDCFDAEELKKRGMLRNRAPETHEEWFCSDDIENVGGPLELEFLHMWLSLHPEIRVKTTEENEEESSRGSCAGIANGACEPQRIEGVRK